MLRRIFLAARTPCRFAFVRAMLCTASLCLIHGVGWAEDAPEQSRPGHGIDTETVVVRASRLPPEDGTSTGTVTGREAQDLFAHDIGELLKSSVPGVSGQRYAGSHVDPVVRGLRADQLNVAVDGARIWGACPHRMDPATSLVDVEDIDAVQVVKGPYALTQGPPGLGGSINVMTTQPAPSDQWAAGGSVAAGYVGNYDGWNTHAGAWGSGPEGGVRLSGSYRNFGDYESGDGERVPSGFENRSLQAKTLWQPTPEDGVHLDFSVDSDRDTRYASSMMDADEDDAYLGSVTYGRERPIDAIDDVETSVYYSDVHHRMSNRHKPGADTMEMVSPLDSRTVGGRVQANRTVFGTGRLSVGGDGYALDRDGTRRTTMLTGMMKGMTQEFPVYPDAHILNGGPFAELVYPIAPRFRAVAASRIDFVDAGAASDHTAKQVYVKYYGPAANDLNTQEVNVSANARLIYSPIETIDVFVGVGRGVRTADVTERFYALGPGRGGYVVGNPSLDPEQSLETDLGASGQWRRLSFGTTLFYNHVQDFIQQTRLASADINMDGIADTIYGYRNLDLATFTGVELNAQYELLDGLAVNGSAAYVRGENEDDDTPLPEIAPLEGTLGLRFERVTARDGWLWVAPSVRMVDRQDRIDEAFGEDETPGFATADLRAGFRWQDRYEIVVSLLNLLDTNYWEHMTRSNPYTGSEVPEPGRMATVSLRVTL